MPKPFLKKGTGKYTKIDYPVLRRSGVYYPDPDSSQPRPQQQAQHRQPLQQERSSPSRDRRRDRSPQPYSFSPSPAVNRSSAPLSMARLNLRPAETGVLGQQSPSISDLSKTSDSPPRTTAFGSSLERRMAGDSDEGVRDLSPGLPSGRPRTAGTTDSGFPREELPLLSPSSSGETRASSMPSMIEDLTLLNRDIQADLLPAHSPLLATPAAVAAFDEDEVRVEPAATAVPPVPSVRRSRQLLDHSMPGPSTQEYERREQEALREQMRESPLTIRSSSSFSSSTNGLAQDARKALNKIKAQKGEEPIPRFRAPPSSESATATREELLGRLQSQRMMEVRLDASVASDAPVLSPIENSTGLPKNVLEGHTFRGSEAASSRPGSSSHFRIATSSADSAAEAAADERRQKLRDRSMQYPSREEERRRSEEESSEASSGSTANARRYLGMDLRRPMDEVSGGTRREEITMTQQRPPHHRTRASQATLRRPITIQEEYDESHLYEEEEPSLDLSHVRPEEPRRRGDGGRGRTGGVEREEERRGREVAAREERVRLMESQLRDAIAHVDMADAAFRRLVEENQRTFSNKLGELSAAYAAKERKAREDEKKREEEWKKKNAGIEKVRSDLKRERGQLDRDESAKVKEWRTKFEEEKKKYEEEKKKNATEVSKRRVVEERAKKDSEKAAAAAADLQSKNDRLRRMLEAADRRSNGGLQKATAFGGSMNNLAEKENLVPSGSSPATPRPLRPAVEQHPQGILKKSQVRFADADTTYTVYPPEELFYETARGYGELGPFITFTNECRGVARVSKPDCGCIVIEHTNGDIRHITPDGVVQFYFISASGTMQLEFRSPIQKQRKLVVYHPDGTLEIFRTGKQITKCAKRGGKIERTETIKGRDGEMHAEIWENNAMAVYSNGQRGNSRDLYKMGAFVTHRDLGEGGITKVALHSTLNLEFYEGNFHAIYYAATQNLELAVNAGQANEMRYHLYPGEFGRVRHTGAGLGKSLICIEVGRSERLNNSQR